ncbi:hypothetical protein [uncultured Roseovarius sp.]|uniref:hypothetical protein n=1 Tax=uncultured Roseovarius sp. TaxID=293344 RepID=UPI0026211106|nr:hypothetical protein [uncultured Roseovarius sp.]
MGKWFHACDLAQYLTRSRQISDAMREQDTGLRGVNRRASDQGVRRGKINNISEVIVMNH